MTELSSELCELASRLAIAAGDLVFEGRKNGLTSISTKSSDTDIVTEFDRASEHLIVEGIRAERPSDRTTRSLARRERTRPEHRESAG